MKLWPITFLIISGCASHIERSVKNPVTIVTKQLQSQPVIEEPPPGITRVPQDVNLAWTPPNTNADQVVSYNIYYSTEPDMYYPTVIPVGNVTNGLVTGLIGGCGYYFAVTDLGPDGGESDYSPFTFYTPPVVVDLLFAFDQPVTNVVLQSSFDLIHWQDLATIPTNGVWRINADQRLPAVIYRSTATTVP